MATKPRMIVPNAFYQIRSACIPELKAFSSEKMKTYLLKQISISKEKYAFKCFSWSIMDNHYHLVVQSSEETISKFMQRVNFVFAKYFNRINKRKGTVFGRFSSVIIQEDKEHIEKAIRYIHFNPVRRKDCTVKGMDQHRWSGHYAMVNGIKDDILDREDVIGLFGSLENYRSFIQSGDPYCRNDEVIEKIRKANKGCQSFSKPEFWVIGDEEFVGKMIEINNNRRVRLARHVVENVTLDSLIDRVGACINRKREELIDHSGRMNEISTARELFALVGVNHFGFSCINLGTYLGVSGSAVSKMISRSCRINELEFLKEMVCT
jgi:REP element-mobilizing transposase RayT